MRVMRAVLADMLSMSYLLDLLVGMLQIVEGFHQGIDRLKTPCALTSGATLPILVTLPLPASNDDTQVSLISLPEQRQ